VIDIWVLLIAGILGAVLRKNGFPLGPLVLGYIIGPGMERALRQALIIGGEDRFFLFKSSIAIGLYVATIIFLVLVNIIFRKKTDKSL
jgi:putative tricarboxylic transport membrane protein